jgi:hypothetical protein
LRKGIPIREFWWTCGDLSISRSQRATFRNDSPYVFQRREVARCEIIPQQPNKWTLPEEGALQWADEQQHQEEVELDEDGRPLTPPPPLFLSLYDSYRNRDVAAAMNRYFSRSCQAVSRLLRGWATPWTNQSAGQVFSDTCLKTFLVLYLVLHGLWISTWSR